MELRHYWRVLARRRNVIRNTFLLVALFSLATVAFGYYTSAYKAHASFDVQVQPESQLVSGAVTDPEVAASQHTDQVVLALLEYGKTVGYFKAVQNGLKKQGVSIDWKALGASIDIHSGLSHDITVAWSSSDENVALKIVTVAAAKLESFISTYQNVLLPTSAPIRVDSSFDPPSVQRVSFTKPLADLALRLVIGLVAGIILAYLFEYLDNTVQDEADIERLMHLPTLAVIPGGRGRRARSA